MSDTERISPSGAENIFGKIVIPTIGIVLALVRIGVCASPAESEPLQTPMYLAQDKGQRTPIFVDSSCSTQHLIKALKEAENPYQRRYAAQLLSDRGAREAVPYLLDTLNDPEEVAQKAAAEALAKLGDRSLFDRLIANTTATNGRVRKYSAYVLGWLANKEDRTVVEVLEALAGDEDENVRAEATYALYKIGSPTSKNIFIGGLNDHEPRVRNYSATALGSLKGTEAGRALVIALHREKDEDVRRTIASALGKVGSVDATRALVDALAYETESVKADIVVALGEAKSPAAIQALIGLLSDPSGDIRSKAAIALLNAKDPSSVKALAAALNDRVASVRRPASEALKIFGDSSVLNEMIDALGNSDSTVADNMVEALIRIGDLDAVHGLINSLGNPNQAQSERAIAVLEEITRRPYGSDAQRWKQWYEENFKSSD